MKRILVVGCGMIGRTIAEDLAAEFVVSVIDNDVKRLNAIKEIAKVSVLKIDITDTKRLKLLIKQFDLVVSAVPGHLGFNTLKAIIEAGKNVVDISFFKENPFKLDDLAKTEKVTAVVDCGIAPGLSNIILGYYNKRIKIKKFECYVGGLPLKKVPPFEYKAPFSPIDVIEEYTRKARVVENGVVKTKPALSELELVNIPLVGTLEAFNTDGLRSLLRTMKIPNMKEKTLRYPGHAEKIKLLSQAGFFSKKLIDVNGEEIRPVELISKLLFPLWKLEKDEEEFTVLQLLISGMEENKRKEVKVVLYDKFDKKTKNTSMARTTGFTCTAVVRLLMNKTYKNEGISAPEFVGESEICFNFVLNYLTKNGINLSFEEKYL